MNVDDDKDCNDEMTLTVEIGGGSIENDNMSDDGVGPVLDKIAEGGDRREKEPRGSVLMRMKDLLGVWKLG